MSRTYLLAIITYLVGYGCWVIVVMSGIEESEEGRKGIPNCGSWIGKLEMPWLCVARAPAENCPKPGV